MIKKIVSLILSIKIIKLLTIRFLNKNKYLIIKSEFVNLKTNIGNSVTIMEGCVIDHLTTIGDYCYIGRYCYLTKVNIGNYCSIANNVSIGQGEHDLNKISTNSIFYENPFDELTKNDCEIGNDVWIGVDSIIRKVVRIGNGAVIGINYVVTKNVPAFAVVVGVPAKIIKFRFDIKKQKKILLSKWWKKNKDKAKIILKDLK
ncbi:CatB-related O-acetyltransferase [Aliarcobacter butzleri]|uniref:CatB-related O-acetyltransferase n=1 Tax=Aliarcobacter butzleri TaxID=28197 RepID=UPI003B217DFB